MLDPNKVVRKMGHRKARKQGITAQMQQVGVVNVNRPPQYSRDYVSPDEELLWEAQQKGGQGFRCVFFCVIAFMLLLLCGLHWDKEMSLQLPPPPPSDPAATGAEGAPQTGAEGEKPKEGSEEAGKEGEKAETTEAKAPEDSEEKKPDSPPAEAKDKDGKEEEKPKTEGDQPEAPPAAATKDGEAAEKKEGEQAPPASTEENAGQLSVPITTPLFEVLNATRRMGKHELKKKYEEALAMAETNPDSKWKVANIKEAYDILASPDSRTYYMLYQHKPPEFMKKRMNNQFGGWGIEFALGTYKIVMLRQMLDQFNSGWLELGLLGIIVAIIGTKLYNSMDELNEKMEQMQELMEMTDAERKGESPPSSPSKAAAAAIGSDSDDGPSKKSK